MDISQAQGQMGDVVAWHCPLPHHRLPLPSPQWPYEVGPGLERVNFLRLSLLTYEMGKTQPRLPACWGTSSETCVNRCLAHGTQVPPGRGHHGCLWEGSAL